MSLLSSNSLLVALIPPVLWLPFAPSANTVLRADELDEHGVDDSGAAILSYPCRCGGVFVVPREQLDEGFDVFGCEQCSLHVRVLAAQR